MGRSLEAPPSRIERRTFVHGSVQVEQQGSKSCEGSNGDTFGWRGKARCLCRAKAGWDATGNAQRVSLAKIAVRRAKPNTPQVYYTAHLAVHRTEASGAKV